MKALYWHNELHAWNLSDTNTKTFQNLGFEVREMSRQELLTELKEITRINQQKELDELLGDGEFFESIE